MESTLSQIILHYSKCTSNTSSSTNQNKSENVDEYGASESKTNFEDLENNENIFLLSQIPCIKNKLSGDDIQRQLENIIKVV